MPVPPTLDWYICQIFSNFLLPTPPIHLISQTVPAISATDRARTVLFECLFNHLADDRVASLFTILGFEHDFTCYAIAGYPARSAPAAVLTLKKSWPILAEHV